jgi:hypothetical protein
MSNQITIPIQRTRDDTVTEKKYHALHSLTSDLNSAADTAQSNLNNALAATKYCWNNTLGQWYPCGKGISAVAQINTNGAQNTLQNHFNNAMQNSAELGEDTDIGTDSWMPPADNFDDYFTSNIGPLVKIGETPINGNTSYSNKTYNGTTSVTASVSYTINGISLNLNPKKISFNVSYVADYEITEKDIKTIHHKVNGTAALICANCNYVDSCVQCYPKQCRSNSCGDIAGTLSCIECY